ncbi:S8 family serine peptidase [Methyloglobulus sp.]|uniref:S8 family serine peptidase n=1 Tax=Methyloglobulus sp. TaxID=2518622 RepID=UPI0032B74FA7
MKSRHFPRWNPALFAVVSALTWSLVCNPAQAIDMVDSEESPEEVAEAATTVPATPTASTPDQGLGAPLYGMDDPKRIPGSYLVAMKKDNQLKASLSAFSAVAGLSMTSQYVMKGFQGFAAKMTDTALEQIRKNPNVAYVEANRIISLEKPTNAKVETDSITSLAFPASWGQDRVDQHDLPLDDSFNPQKTGRGVNVYVLDTGIRRTHQEFGNRVAAGATFIFDGQGTNDCSDIGHGTHVAGTIGGKTVGIATEVTLIPVRVLGCDGFGSVESITHGVEWVTNNARYPAVANMSLTTSTPSRWIDEAVATSIANNINYITAAGNNDVDACSASPGRVSGAITVGATIDTDARWVGSNWGSCVDVFAPGVDIRSAHPHDDSAYFTNSGTSMAAPHVAGAVAAMLTPDPLYPSPVVKPYSLERRIQACSTKFAVRDAKSINNHLLHLCQDVQFEFGDVNNDKREDMIRFGEMGTEVALATLSGYQPFKQWIANFGYNSGWRTTRHVRRVADVNGDGRADIVGFGEKGVYVATSTGTQFEFKGKWINDYAYLSGAWRIADHERRVADVNGDKKADLIAFGNFGVYVALSTGTSFTFQPRWSSDFNPTTGWDKRQHVRHVADINGDGKADIVGFGGDGVHVALSSGSSFDYKGRWIDDFAIGAGGWSVYRHERQLGDVNGDGKADIVGFGEDAVYVSLSTGISFSPITAPQPEFDYESGWRVADTYSPFGTAGTSLASLDDFAVAHPRFVTDFTGNGRADIIGLGNVIRPFKEAAFAVATSYGFGSKMLLTLPKE